MRRNAILETMEYCGCSVARQTHCNTRDDGNKSFSFRSGIHAKDATFALIGSIERLDVDVDAIAFIRRHRVNIVETEARIVFLGGHPAKY